MKPRRPEQEHRLCDASSNTDDVLTRAVRMALDVDPSPNALARLGTRLRAALQTGGANTAAGVDEHAAPAIGPWRGIGLIAILGLGTTLIARNIRETAHDRPLPQSATVTQAPAAEKPTLADFAAPREAAAMEPGCAPAPPVRSQQGALRRHRAIAAIESRSELEILRAAQRALPNAPNAALTLLHAHRRAYAHGVLEQERELLAIEALLALHELNAARERARAFSAAFPRSVHARRLQRLLSTANVAMQTTP
jgi:hypothetical protein